MKLAIHHRPGSFSERWIAYCEQEGIDYQIVNCYHSDIVEQIRGCDALMWHHHHAMYKDVLAARKILNALEHSGLKVFPDFNTGWTFDDKVAQKYLLEAINAPLIPSYIFYDKDTALDWVKSTIYPKVWKLKGGASGANVRLIHSKNEAVKLVKKSFGRGFSQYDKLNSIIERYKLYKNGRGSFMNILKGIARIFVTPEFAKMVGNEKGYVYFQEFIPHNTRDNRIIVINNKAFGVSRLVGKGDFKSGDHYGVLSARNDIDERCVAIAFEISSKLKTQSLGIDFIFDKNKNPVIAEMGYGFIPATYASCPGYWDSNLNWHEEKFHPEDWMVENIISLIKTQSN